MHTIKPTYFKPFISLLTAFLFICQPLMSAEIVLDTRTHAAGHTMLDAAANGTPVVNIARPNTNGVSHNTYIEFNVPTQGTILNNAGQEVNTQLAGYIYGNENVRDGSASLILNEVSGTNRSRLNGYLEVAGPSADVIVANPNGITVNGGGFINIPKATLTTGKVSFNGDRPIFDIEGGDIFIDGKGLDARGASSLELYTQALKLNAKLHADELQVVTGLNHIDETGKVTSTDSEGEARPAFSIDSTALGGIYANAISLVGTQKGVGVNLPVEMLVQERLELSADGRIVLGKVSVGKQANIRSESSSIEVHEGVHADTLEMKARGDITLKGNTGATSNLTLLGNTLTNEGIVAAGVNADFTPAQEGLLSLSFTEKVHNIGVLYGLTGTSIDTKDFINADQAEVITGTLLIHAAESLHNAGELRADFTTLNTQALGNEGLIHANDLMELTASSFDNTEGTVEGLDRVTLNIANAFLNNHGILFSNNVLTLTTNTLDNTDGTIQAGETLTVSAAGDIDNTRGTLYAGTGTTVTAQSLDNEEGFIGSIKAVFLDLFGLNGDNGTISGEGVTVHTETMQSSHATLLSSAEIDIDASGDVTLTNSTILANSGLNLTASVTTLNGSTLYAAYDSVTINSSALQLENVYMEANRLLSLYASEDIDVSDSTLRGNSVQVSAAEDITVTNANVVALVDLGIEAQTLDLSNASLSAQNRGTIHTGTLNNSDSMVSAAQMQIDTITLNNADSYLYSAGGTLNIIVSDALNNGHGLISANGNLAVDAASFDNRNGELEAGNTLAVSSGDLQIENSRFFAGEHLDVTSNIATIDAATKFLSANAMDLDFAGDLAHHGEILANGTGNIMVHGDLDNEGSITANGSLYIAADMLNNNANDTGASIRGGHLSDIMLNGDLNNHGFLTSSGDLEITAASVHNYAGIAAAYGLTLNSANLYNYNTLLSGTDMQLYISDLLRNHEAAEIYAGASLTIASDETGGKTGIIENISARIESGSDMVIAAGELSNISATEITTILQQVNGRIDITCDIWESFSCPALAIPLETDLMAIKAEIIQEYSDKGVTLSESELQGLLTERMVQEDREAYILNMYKDTKTTAGELYFYELTASLDSNAMIVKRTKPHKKEEFRKVDYGLTAEVVDATLLASHKEGEIVSGRNLLLDADTITNRTSLIAAGNDIAINGNLFNIGVESTEAIDATINYSWKRKGDSGLGQLPVSKSEIRDTEGVPSQILAGGTLTGNFGVLQNGMEAGASVTMDPDAPTISTSTQTTEETQQTVTLPDTNADLANVDQGTIENTALALTPQVYDTAAESITLPDNPYGLFVVSTDPEGPLIESNPEYTDYRNFVSSDYMLERLGYDGSSQLRRLGDAMYETQLIRDAIMAMTGERFIGMAENDSEQYIDLMHAGIAYAQEVGLELGVPPTALQLKDLKEDLVWMEEKTIQGQQVLVPVLYLAKDYSKPTGANIAANRMDLTVDGHLNNSGNIQTREEMRLRTGTLTNNRGNIEAGNAMRLSAIGDIQNLSGSMKGGSVVLKSEEGNIVNKTLSKGLEVDHGVGKEHYTLMDKTASIEAANGALVLDAGKNIENTGAALASKEGMLLKAKEDVTIQTLQDTKSYDYTFDHGYAKGESVAHLQSDIRAGGLLDVKAGDDANLEAVNIKAENARINAENNVNLTAVTDSSYSSSYVERDGSFSSSTVTDVSLQQSVKGTTIDTGIVQIEGKEGVTLESARLTAAQAASISSQKGDVSFTAKSYTNASYHEESDSMLGGLVSSRSVDAVSETLLADSSASAESQIVVGGKNVHLVATDLETANGGIKLSAAENINIVSGMESRSETHIREESGVDLGLSDGRLTIAEETKDSIATEIHTNKASNITTNALLIESGQDSNVIASNITAGVMQVDADRDFNVLSDKDTISTNEAHSKKEIGVEVTLNSEEASLFAGYWEEKHGEKQRQSQAAGSNIVAGNLQVNAQNANVVGSNIAGQDINIEAENIRVLSDTTNTQTDAYTSAIKAGIEVSVKQNLSQAVNAIAGVGESESGSAVAARSLQSYDAVQSFAEQPVTASVNAIYEETNTNTHSTNGQVSASSITATNTLTLNAKNELEIAGSDVGSANALTVNASTINIHASEGTYTTDSSSESKNANVGLYGTRMGQATVGYQENEMGTEGTYQRNSQLYAGGTATLTSAEDTTLSGANIEAKNLELNVGGDLHMQSLQDRQTIEGSSKGGSISGSVLTGTPTGSSANAGQTSGEEAWVSQTTGMNGSESVTVNVGGTTTLTGATIANVDAKGIDQGNLELNTQHLVLNDIKDIDTYESSSAGAGVGSNDGAASLNSVEYTNNTKDKEQVTRATIGSGTINTQTTTGTLNRDTSKTQEITKEEESNTEIYVSNRTLELLDDPSKAISDLGNKLKDAGLTAQAEILNNLPTTNGKKNADGNPIGEDGNEKNALENFIDETFGAAIDAAGEWSFGVIPTAKNNGGYITQIAIIPVGDNMVHISSNDESKMKALGLTNKRNPDDPDANWDYEEYTKPDGSVEYRTNPEKAVRIDEPRKENDPLDAYKIHISSEAIEASGINSVFTNGLNNSPDEALVNQQTQQGNPEIGILNYNKSHGTLADLIETGLEKTTIALDFVPGVQEIGYVVNGGARQTGNTIAQISHINGGNVNVAAHSQGTQQTYLGIQQQQENIAKDLQDNPTSVFTLQNSGSPVSSDAAQDLVVNGLYGGEENIKDRFQNDQGADNVFYSQVNPGDPIGALGGNFGGVNNNTPIYTSEYWEQVGYTVTRGVPTLMDSSTSPHSGYGCQIGCGENGVTGKKDQIYNTQTGEFDPIRNFYIDMGLDPSQANNTNANGSVSRAENPIMK